MILGMQVTSKLAVSMGSTSPTALKLYPKSDHLEHYTYQPVVMFIHNLQLLIVNFIELELDWAQICQHSFHRANISIEWGSKVWVNRPRFLVAITRQDTLNTLIC